MGKISMYSLTKTFIILKFIYIKLFTIFLFIKTGGIMSDHVYKIIELVGTSSESWEKAAANAVKKASESLRDLRIAEVSQLDLQINEGKIEAYRAKVKVSFKYEGHH